MFNPKEYAQRCGSTPPTDATSIAAIVEACGGVCGEVETGESTLTYQGASVRCKSQRLPVFHAEDFDRQSPVEWVLVSSEMEAVA